MKRLLLPIALLWLTGCGADATTETIKTEDLVTVQQGVAGRSYRAKWGPDDGLESSTPLADIAVTIESDDGAGGLTKVTTLTSDQDGFFEYSLEPGDYVISEATSSDSRTFTVTADGIMLCTFLTPSGLGPHWSCSSQ